MMRYSNVRMIGFMNIWIYTMYVLYSENSNNLTPIFVKGK